MRLLFVADVVGSPGRRAVRQFVPRLRAAEGLDFVIANAENVAGGIGITRETSEELLASGIDALTTGNHGYDKPEMLAYIVTQPRIVRPANYPDGAPGAKLGLYPTPGGVLALLTVLGRTFMKPLEDPFKTAREQVAAARAAGARFTVIDMHAEATSEKVAFGWWMDGLASAVVGTHTHVPTADERVLPGGTAYITDLGMTGPFDSVIGVEKAPAISRFVTGLPAKFKPAGRDTRLCGAIIDLDDATGRALGIRRIQERLPDPPP